MTKKFVKSLNTAAVVPVVSGFFRFYFVRSEHLPVHALKLRLSLTNFLMNGMHSVKDSLLGEEPQLRTQVLFRATHITITLRFSPLVTLFTPNTVQHKALRDFVAHMRSMRQVRAGAQGPHICGQNFSSTHAHKTLNT